jgi:hypothetical protein
MDLQDLCFEFQANDQWEVMESTCSWFNFYLGQFNPDFLTDKGCQSLCITRITTPRTGTCNGWRGKPNLWNNFEQLHCWGLSGLYMVDDGQKSLLPVLWV